MPATRPTIEQVLDHHLQALKQDLSKLQQSEQPTLDTYRLRQFVYSVENALNEAIEGLMPIHHDDVLAKVYSALIAAQQDTLEIRAMLPSEEE